MITERKLRVVPRSWEPFRREPVAAKYAEYVPQPEDGRVARAVIRNIHDATPGGLRREQFIRGRHPVKTALAAFPFVALVALCIVAIVTRHHP